jgi:MoxR-like ATPase
VTHKLQQKKESTMNTASAPTTKKTNGTSSVTKAAPAASDLAALESELNHAFPERREVIRALLTAAVAGEHAFMLGLPGTAKSNLARVMSSAFQASYFEYLMTRFTEPSELFGPVDPAAFKLGKYARVTTNKFPEAEVVFLDEVWKANSAIANSLLTALNERTYDSGSGPKALPLMTCIGASNELPESAELDAIYDRFLIRLVTNYIVEDEAFFDLVKDIASGNRRDVSTKVDLRAEQAAAKAVKISDETLRALTNLRASMKGIGVVVSDRRWVQCLSVVRAAAHLDGRTETDPADLEVLESVLWRKPDERVTVARTIQQSVSPDGAKAVEELDAARECLSRLPNAEHTDKGTYLAAIGSATTDLKEIAKRVDVLKSGRKVDAAKVEIAAIRKEVGKLGMKAAGIEF